MDKNDILRELKKINANPNDFRIATGAALVLYGVRELTHDIDVGCSSGVIEYYQKNGYTAETLKDGSRKIVIEPFIELFENWADLPTQKLFGYNVLTLDSIVKLKTQLGREKDFRDIKLIEEFKKRS